MSKVLYIVEGGVGAGKTTLCEQIGKNVDVCYALEDWNNSSFLLKSFYGSPSFDEVKIASSGLQFEILTRFYYIILNFLQGDRKACIVDRGILGSISFSNYAGQVGLMPKEMSNLLEALILKSFKDICSSNPDLKIKILYLDCEPEIAFARMRSRGDTPFVFSQFRSDGEPIYTPMTREKIEFIYKEDSIWLETVSKYQFPNLSIDKIETTKEYPKEKVEHIVQKDLEIIFQVERNNQSKVDCPPCNPL